MTHPHPRWCPLLIAQAVGAWAIGAGIFYALWTITP